MGGGGPYGRDRGVCVEDGQVTLRTNIEGTKAEGLVKWAGAHPPRAGGTSPTFARRIAQRLQRMGRFMQGVFD